MTSKTGKRLNPFQHALQRPDTYIGDCETTIKEVLVFINPKEKEDDENEFPEDEEQPEVDEDGNDIPKKRKAIKDAVLGIKKISYNAGLLKLYGEILSNAIDNKWRSEKNNIKMTRIDITCDNDPDSEWYGYITIRNDGYFIPIEKQEYKYEDYRTDKTIVEDLYPAEVFFGEMLAGTNFDDNVGRKTSGRNGMGGKTAVIFSEHCIIEHTDPERGKKFEQTYSEHGKQRSKPKITKYTGKSGYTQVSFLPDYAYFNYEGMDESLWCLCKRFAYEAAMITGLIVTFNGEKLVVKDLEKFVRLIYPDVKENKLMSFASPTGDECVVVERGIPDMDQMEDVVHHAWVNGIHTKDGGTHVAAWKEAIMPNLVKTFNARKPPKGEKTATKTSGKEMYPYFTMFVRCEVEDPKFDSQTKDMLTKPNPFDLVCSTDKKVKKEFSDAIGANVTKMMKWGFIDLLEEKLLAKSERAQNKKEKIPKKLAGSDNYTDANYAGKKEASKCRLFITEGLSAKAFADRYIAKIPNGTDYFGSFALKGKFINVTKATSKQINTNKEVIALKKILGLTTGEKYSTITGLRYGGVFIMTDQDDDGFHISSLIQNFFYEQFPELIHLQCDNGLSFVSDFVTLVTYLMKGKKIVGKYYSNADFENWYSKQSPESLKGITMKYLKGLGSHKPGDEEFYLEEEKIRQYYLDGNEAHFMSLAFDDSNSNARKEWITRDVQKPGEILLEKKDDLTPIQIEGPMSMSEFIDNIAILYHQMARFRALPDLMDGFKDSQRRVFYGTSKDVDAKRGTVVVEELAGTVKKETGYHHGAVSLENTFKGMAAGFVGSNNIPLLVNDGEFGTRKMGGKDASAARYIATNLEEITSAIFDSRDEPLLTPIYENTPQGKRVKRGYKQYRPVIPMILINGVDGIASGWSSKIPCYNPDDICDWIESWLDSDPKNRTVELPLLTPWYRGHTGQVELLQYSGNKTEKYMSYDYTSESYPVAWRSVGSLEQMSKPQWWKITEAPIGLWTSTLNEHIDALYTGTYKTTKKDEKPKPVILEKRWRGTPNTVNWEFKVSKDFIPDIDIAGNFKILQKTYTLTNMHILDANGYPRKYSSPEEILQDFCRIRLKQYSEMKSYWIDEYGIYYSKAKNKYDFVTGVINGEINMNQKKAELYKDLEDSGFVKFETSDKREDDVEEDIEEEAEDQGPNRGFDYLLNMKMSSMTVELLEKLKKDMLKFKKLIDDLKKQTPTSLWKERLENFRKAWAKFQKTRREE